MKKVTIRIFLSIFVLWFFSLWLNIVYGQTQDYPDYENSNNCWNLPNHSSDSNNGNSYTKNPSSPYPWYINNPNAIIYATNYQWNPNVCSNTNLANNVSRTDWKKQLCTSGVNQLKNHQEELLTKYKNYIGCTHERWFASTKEVWGLQNLMKNANCQNHRDCKLWVVTIWDFLFCNVCQAISGDRKELKSFNPLECENWYTLTDDDLCCMPTPECVAPIVKINWEENKTTYSEDYLDVELDYSNNEVWEIILFSEKIKIEPDNVLSSDIHADEATKKMDFTLSTEWTNSISININDWWATLEAEQCPWINITLAREVPCQNVNERQQCSNSDDFDAPEEPITDYSFLENKICNKNWTDIEFCPCKTPPENNNCDKYWTGRYLKDDCCNKCPSNKKVNEEWDDCVCTTSSSCNQSWYVFNDETCKCECDPTQRCCGILLNTVVPFIGDCIEMTTQNSISDPSDPNKSRVNQLNAFPFLMMWLSKILVTIILIFSFLIIIAAWLMMTTGVYKEQNYKTWVDRITKVIVWLILLWASGLILRLINPSFFGW